MELADVTDSKSVGSNTVRVRPPPSAPSNKPTLFMRGLIAFVPMAGGRTRNLRVAQGCAMAVTQSRCTMHRPPTTANARMRDSACPRFRTDAKPTEQARFDNPTPPHFHPLNEWGYYFWCGGWANTHRAGKARTPYKMNAQRLCTDAKPSKRS